MLSCSYTSSSYCTLHINPGFCHVLNLVSCHEQPQQADPFLCTCGPCKRFWQETFKSSTDCLFNPSEDRAALSATLGKHAPQALVSVGDRVTVDGKPGSVKFVGFVDDNVIAPSLRVGIKLDESVHMGHDGMFNGKRYFYCTNGHGILVRYKDVKPLRPANRRPPVKGNPMFPSWPEICKRRKQRAAMLENMEKKSSKTSKPGSSAKTPRPPLISPRENRTQKLRQEASSAPFLIVRDDPNDVHYRDIQHRRKKEMLVASMSTPEATQANWEVRLMQQWQRKYKDHEKASRMGETLQRLCSAYQEGMKFRHVQMAE
ncbi:hypothetical protein BaRGS_00003074 [Batillaria attramentaria]|uniref:CAP-Gly domain-containing protein n=1 Tax=Batillaria attramentaria TaxID=370345 RepID=A0ABD0M3H7_9CAEN